MPGNGRGNWAGSGSRNAFALSIIREAVRQSNAGASGSLVTSISAFPLASAVASTDRFPLVTSAGIGYRATATLIRDYVLGISGGIATIPENVTVEGNTVLGNATSDTITFGGRMSSAVEWTTDNTLDVGASGANRPRRGYFGTELLAPTGTFTNIAGTLTTASQPNVTTMTGLTTIGTLVAGAVPASLVTAGTFGTGAYTFPSTLAVTGAITAGTYNGQTISSAANFTGTITAASSIQSGANLIFSGLTPVIRTTTVDGSDTAALFLTPGSAASNTRGAVIALYGNEEATNPGRLYLDSGNATAGHWSGRVKGVEWLNVTRPAAINVVAITGQTTFSDTTTFSAAAVANLGLTVSGAAFSASGNFAHFITRSSNGGVNVLALNNLDSTAATLHGSGLLWTFSTTAPTTVQAAQIFVDKLQEWTSTAATQDSRMRLLITIDGTLTSGLTLSSSSGVHTATFPSAVTVTGALTAGTVTSNGRTNLYPADSTILNLRNTLGTVDVREWSFRIDTATGAASFRSTTDLNTTVATAFTVTHATGAVAFGSTISATSVTATGLIQTTLTTEQMRLRYDASNYLSATVSSAGVVTLDAVGSGARFLFNDDIGLESTKAFHFGDPTTDGTWRFVRSGNDLVISRRESGSYITKSTITA